MSSQPVRWGIISTANIGIAKVIPGMLKSRALTVAAIASRDLTTARAAADKLGIPTAYGSYKELLADPTIEAVYNPLPNHLHVPLTLEAAKAGKHVLCEKPMSITPEELDALAPYADKVHIREAFMVRHHPQWQAVRQHIRDGAIGEPRFIQVPFSYYLTDPENVRNKADIGGGGLLDIGCYAIVAGRYFFDAEPESVAAVIDRDPTFGTDRTTSGLLAFSGGRQLAFTVSTQSTPWQRVQIAGTKGCIEIEIPFNQPPDRPARYLIDDGSALDGSGIRAITLPIADQYQLQAEDFSRAVRDERPDSKHLEDARRNMRILSALLTSAASGRFERP